jgi:DNA polymerase III delta prime subunit
MSEETTSISKNPKDWIWVERYRPSNIDNYICTGEFRARIDEWMNGENSSHLFFESGMPGTGKTTLAKIIASTISSSILFINASMDNGIDTIRNKVSGFVSRMALDGRKKVVILDEIDNMSAGAIRSLRSLIELYVGHVRFIVTCNDWSQAADEKTRAAFKNRFSFVDFGKVHGSSSEERKEVAMDMFNMAVSILEENEVDYEPEAVARIIKHNFSGALSFRGVIQELQDYAVRGVTMAAIAGSMELELTEILEKVHKRDLKPVREFVHANANRGTAIIGELERNVDKYFDITSENFLNVFFILRECLDRLKNCDLPEIPLTCMFLELGAENVLHSSIAGKKHGKKV